MAPFELQKYFCQDKSDWFVINNAAEKEWNNEKVIEFWERIRKHKIAKRDYNFENFIFPKFESRGYNPNKKFSVVTADFWNNGQPMRFEGRANFERAKFLDVAIFHNMSFKSASFLLAVFEDSAYFNDSHFFGLSNFSDSKFLKNVSFSRSKFSKINFRNCLFNDLVSFDYSHFNDIAIFDRVDFQLKGTFNYSIFKHETQFNFLQFNPILDFIYTYFNASVTFNTINFKELNINLANRVDFSHDEVKYSSKPPIINFSRSNLNSLTVLSRIDLNRLSFNYCDVSNISFSRCDWNIKGNRLLLYNELFEPRDSEEHYRGLKKNFDGKKDWEMSGMAYISEMEMRKKRLWYEKEFYQWFIYWFYGFFGGYTQDFKRPLVSLIGLIGIFSFIFYFIDYNILKAFQRGIKGALPYISIDTEKPFTGYWFILRNIEFLLGGIFLTFFILALRKRFKQ